MISREAAGEAQAYFGWKVVGAAFVLTVFGWGIGFYGPSVFLRTLHDDRGWPIALVSAAITAHFLARIVCRLPARNLCAVGPQAGDPSRHLLHRDRGDALGQRRDCFRSRWSAERARRRRQARRSTRS
jgi:hypothetical protein